MEPWTRERHKPKLGGDGGVCHRTEGGHRNRRDPAEVHNGSGGGDGRRHGSDGELGAEQGGGQEMAGGELGARQAEGR